MCPVDGIGNVNPSVPPASGGGEHASHGNGVGTVPAFSAAYANALTNASPAAPPAGHAHAGAPAAVSTAAGNAHGAHASASMAGGSRHIPLNGQRQGKDHGFQEMVLGLRAYRQQFIASNIANADTPNYKAVDIDFREAVRIAQAAMAGSVDLVTTHGRHLAGSARNTPHSIPLKYHVPHQPSADGNTVEMDVERSKFAENAVMYEFSVDQVKGHYMMMQEMFRNLTK